MGRESGTYGCVAKSPFAQFCPGRGKGRPANRRRSAVTGRKSGGQKRAQKEHGRVKVFTPVRRPSPIPQ